MPTQTLGCAAWAAAKVHRLAAGRVENKWLGAAFRVPVAGVDRACIPRYIYLITVREDGFFIAILYSRLGVLHWMV